MITGSHANCSVTILNAILLSERDQTNQGPEESGNDIAKLELPTWDGLLQYLDGYPETGRECNRAKGGSKDCVVVTDGGAEEGD